MNEKIPFSCDEARQKWFDMAERVYVRRDEGLTPNDLRADIHVKQCQTTECQTLGRARNELLQPKTMGAQELSTALDGLRRSVGLAGA